MQRRKYTVEFKTQVIKEAIETGNCAAVARRYDINSNIVSRWVREAKNKGKTVSSNALDKLHENFEAKQLKAENEQLKKLLGEKELENQFLRDLLKKTNPHLLTKLK